jgi:hypothetical protein
MTDEQLEAWTAVSEVLESCRFLENVASPSGAKAWKSIQRLSQAFDITIPGGSHEGINA